MSENILIITEQPSDEDVIRLTSQGFDQPVTEEFANNALEVVRRCENFQLAVDIGEIALGYVGYTHYSLEVGNTIYINTIMIDASQQGTGLASQLLMGAVRSMEDIRYVGFKTQSARMYSAAKRVFGNIYPTFSLESIPDDITTVGNDLALIRGGPFPIHKGLYGGRPLYGSRPEANGISGFYESIDFEAGDALLCICKVLES